MIRIFNSDTDPIREIISRDMNKISGKIERIVSDIIENVRANGDSALKEYSLKFDKTELDSFEVTDEEITEAFAAVDDKFIDILKEARENIYEFHKRQIRDNFVINDANGVILGQKIIPIEKVGLYVPGGTAPLPSTVLMTAVPAMAAGVSEIFMTTPPNREGRVNPVILAAAKIAGVGRIFKVGGAQAIAALAYGTQSIPVVDKIVGPGNAFVAEAKKQVFGKVGIDMIAGPSDICVVADNTNDPAVIATDMLSQAEHDKLATAVLVTTDEEFANDVAANIEKQLAVLPREEIARTSIDNNGMIIVTDTLEKAIEIANLIAPEHLELCVDNPFDYLNDVKNAGSIFLGKNCPEPLGDYFAGPNHTLPTNGTSRFSSPLSVDDFVKKSQFTYFTENALAAVADKVAYFARKEQLEAHARSAEIRSNNNE
ncbi:MAG: histidinol dehydrogenase [Clostridia bacterium]|nr:histidinol dehydrogenase [Clostridia bacterium]